MKTEDTLRMMRMKHLIKYLSLSRAHIYQLIKENKFHPGYRISSGIRAWEKSEVDAWLDKRIGRA
jgi:predicted DNA-binding transcriptional regulator AlpA